MYLYLQRCIFIFIYVFVEKLEHVGWEPWEARLLRDLQGFKGAEGVSRLHHLLTFYIIIEFYSYFIK